MRFSSHTTRPQRAGIAPLELVMSLPFLVGVVAMIFSLGWAALYRSTACVEARHEVWKLRSDPEQHSAAVQRKETKPTSPLGIQNLDPLSGEVYGEMEHEIKLYIGFGTATPKGRSAVLANTWDHKALDGDFDGNGPHVKILWRMALGIGLGAVSGLGGLQNMQLPNQSDIDAAQGEIDKANEQTEKLKEEYRRIIAELERQYQKVKAERDQLVAQRQELIKQRDKLNQEIADLEARIAKQKPPDPALVEELHKKRAERDQLNREIDQKQREIDAKEREMAAIQEEIRRYEQAMEDAEGTVEGLP